MPPLWPHQLPRDPAGAAEVLRGASPLDANVGLRFGVEHLDGYGPLRVQRTLDYLGSASLARLRRAGLTHLVLRPDAPSPPGCEVLLRTPAWSVHRLRQPLPRVRVAHAAAFAPDAASARALLERVEPGAVVLEGEAGRAAASALAGPPGRGAVEVRAWTPDRLEAVVDLPRPGVLVVADTWFPGWEARVDGEAAPVLLADAAWKGVPVPAGEHTVVLRYAPGSFALGAALSALGALLLAVAAGRSLARRPPGPASPSPAAAPALESSPSPGGDP